MRVLVACEFSGTVREAFNRHGHDAWSVDLEPSEIPGKHYQCDMFDVVNEGWDLLIAFPPCTYLSKAGSVWHYGSKQMRTALQFVCDILNLDIPHIALENPVGVISTWIEKPDQIIEPYMFGDPWYKQTCLWLDDLPELTPTNVVEPTGHWVAAGSNYRKGDRRNLGHRDPKERSRTFPGIAEAMAVQWGEYVARER
jgi:hypothetical protein